MSIVIASLLLQAAASAPAAEQTASWPSWRGPSGDGLAALDAAPPLEWSEDHNVRWKVPIDGLGNSTPLILGDRIYLTTAIDLEAIAEGDDAAPQPGPPNSEHKHSCVVLALDRASGEEVWRTVVHETVPFIKQHVTGSHASPSMISDGEHLVASYGTLGLFGLSMDGKLEWSKQLGKKKVLDDFGDGSTPIAYGDSFVVQWDEEGPSFVAAFSFATGEERWRRVRKMDSTWGSPTVAVIDGRAQAILTGSDTTEAYDFETGKTVWTCGGAPKNPTVSPLVHEGVLFEMNSYRGNMVRAIKLAGAKGELQGTEAVLWTRMRGAPYVPTPVAYKGLLYHTRESTGVLNCLDAATGEVLYRGKRLGGMKRIHASPIVAADNLYFVSREGVTLVIPTGPEFEIVADNVLDDVFDATPAFVGDAIYLRGRSHLYCLGE